MNAVAVSIQTFEIDIYIINYSLKVQNQYAMFNNPLSPAGEFVQNLEFKFKTKLMQNSYIK